MRKLFEVDTPEKDNKLYLILLEFNKELEDDEQVFSFVKSRKSTIQSVLDYIEVFVAREMTIDYDRSMVLVEGVDIRNAQTLRSFLNYCISYKYIEDDQLKELIAYGYTVEAKEDDDEEDIVHVATVNNDKISNFINESAIKEEI